jgi:hypothetical protein
MARSPGTAWQSLDSIIEKGGLFVGLVLLMGLVPGCFDSSSKISNAVFATKTSGEPVIQAATNALKVLGYQVGEKTDPEGTSKGLRALDGEKMGGMVTAIGPFIVHIYIVVKSLEKGSEIQVDIIPPRGAYGSTALILHDYQFALSHLLPDLISPF